MGAAHRAHDREPEPGAAGVGLAAEALERLGQTRGRHGVNRRTAVLHPQLDRPDARASLHVHVPAGAVVANAVLDQVGRHALEQRGVTLDLGVVEPGGQAYALVRRMPLGIFDCGLDGRVEVNGATAQQVRLASGQNQQAGEKRLGTPARVHHGFGHAQQLIEIWLRVGERHLSLGSDDGQWAAQLVARVGHETLLACE